MAPVARSCSNSLAAVTLALLIVLFAGIGTGALSQPTDQINGREVIQLSDRARDAIGLKVEKVELRPLPLEVSVLGEIEAMPTKSYVQHAMMAGRVQRVDVELGDRVKPGQVLAVLDSPEVNRLAAELLNTKASMEAEIKKVKSQYATEKNQADTRIELAQAEYDRMSTLAAEKIASERSKQSARAELLLAQATKKNLSTKMTVELEALEIKMKVSVKSLIDRLKQVGVSEAAIKKMLATENAIVQVPVRSTKEGVLTRIMANPGETADDQDPLFEILDLNTVFATADVYENDMERVRVGQRVTIKTSALPGRIYNGTLFLVGAEIDTKKRTLPVKVKITNADLELKPEMFVNMYIETNEPTRAILLPREAVMEKTGHFAVFRQVKPGVYQRTEVEVGRNIGDDVEILGGIEPGSYVVTRGAFQLDAHILKQRGDTDSFSHPSESGEDHDHGEAPAAKKLIGMDPLWVVVVVLAFIGGGVLSAVFLRSSGKGKSSSDQED